MSEPRRAARALAGGAVCLALLAAAAGCAAPSGQAGWNALLAARSTALLRHDRAAFLRTADPAAPGFRAAQRQVFDDLSRLPLASFRYQVLATGAFPVPAPGEVALRTRLEYALRGHDAAPVGFEADLALVRRAGHWYLAGQTDRDPATGHVLTQPWDQGPLSVVTSRDALVFGQAPAAVLRGYATLADAAVPVVRRAWPGRWPGTAVIDVPRTEADMAALLGAPAGTYRDIAAVTTAEPHGGSAAPADRVIVNPQAFAGLSAFGRRVVLTHELTHVATRSATTARTPRWLSEGFADWVGYQGAGRTPRQIAPELSRDLAAGGLARFGRALPSDAAFAPTAPRLAEAYEGAWLACRLVAARWGPARLVALYQAAGREGVALAVPGVLRVSLPAFTALWRDYLVREVG